MGEMSRRAFLRTAAAAAAASGGLPSVTSSAAQPAKRKFTMNLNVGQVGVRATPQEAVKLAQKYGYGSISPMPWAMAKYSQEQLDRLLAEMKAANLAWGAAGVGPFFHADEARFARRKQQIARDAKGLQRAKVKRCFTWVMPSSGARTYRASFRLCVRRVREIGKLLADHGLRIGLEYIGTKTLVLKGKYPFVQTLAEMKELTDEVGLRNVGLALDAWHWFQAGDTEKDILTLTNREVVAADLCDAPAGVPRHQMTDSPRKLPCTTGVIDLKGFLRGLVGIGYDGPVGTEPFDKSLRKLSTAQAMTVATGAMKKAFALIE
jgi:sugar phosphate isomerase/epimerase